MQLVNAVLYGGLGVAGIVFWWRRRTPPAAWLAVTFAILGLIVLQGLIVDSPEPDVAASRLSPAAIYRELLIILLLSTPWLLFRFVRSLRPARTMADRVADAGMIVIALATVLASPLPDSSGPTPRWFTLYLTMVLLWWTVVLASVAWMLWRAGNGQPGVVRQRMRLMSLAALGLTLALVASALLDDGESSTTPTALLVAALGWAGGIGFWLGVLPPDLLRRLWRVEDELALRRADAHLVRAETAEDAAQAVVSAAAGLVGGTAAHIDDAGGRRLASHGTVDPDATTLRVDGDASSVTVATSPYTPIFGRDEVDLLRHLCSHLDLALRRIQAFEASEASRLQTEQVNADLQQLVFGISHDLRNPLVTILGFLQILEADTEGMSDHGRLAAKRIAASAQYMDNLIQDLLQLSRIGRTDAEPTVLPLGPLLGEIAEDVQARHEDVTVHVDMDVEVVMNPVRARQLFTNLVENAARHGQRRPLTITIRSQEAEGDLVAVEVSDDGVGIPSAERERVFQIFQRLQGFDADSPGSGIGLTMCRRIVEDVGGTIEIADAEQGTTMRLVLPSTAGSDTVEPLQPTGA